MSPEQAAGESLDIDARSDIYSLGVLLYELMVGKTPLDERTLREKGYDEMRRIIREVDPPKPSTRVSSLTAEELTTLATRQRIDGRRLGRFLQGDLDVIIMRALAKERSRRFESATSFADEIRRFMDGDPILTQPPGTAERVVKFVRRHRSLVSGVAAVFAALVVGVVTTTWQAIEARQARERAETATREAEEVIRFLNEMLEEVRPARALGRDTAMLREVLDRTAARLPVQLTGQPRVARRLLTTIGRTYEALGRHAEAETVQREALTLARAQATTPDTNTAALLIDLALTLQWQDRYPVASNAVTEALAIIEQTVGPGDLLAARARHRLGMISLVAGDLAGAEAHLTNALAIQVRLVGPGDPAALATGRDLAAFYFSAHRFAEMEPLILRLVADRNRRDGPEHPDTLKVVELLGLLRMEQGRYAEAGAHFDSLLTIRRRLLPTNHANVSTTLDYLGLNHSFAGRYREAEAAAREAIAVVTRTGGYDSARGLVYRSNLAEHLRNQGQYADAETLFREVLVVQDRVLEPDSLNRFETQLGLSVLYQLQGRWADAETWARACLRGRQEIARLPAGSRPVADALSQVVLTLLAQQKFTDAEPLARECLGARAAGPADDWRLPVAQSQLGGCLVGLGRGAEAEALLRNGYEGLKLHRDRLPAIDRPRLLEAGERLIRLLETANQSDGAQRIREELENIQIWVPLPP